MSRYRLSNDAKADLIRIHGYGMKQFGEQQADKYIAMLFEYFEKIADWPYSFEAVDFIKPGYRRCVCGSDAIFYRITDQVEIIAIIGRQDLDSALK